MGVKERHGESLPHHIIRMVVKSGGNWKRPVNRMYTYNFQIGENYYLPMTSCLETKNGAASDVPGPLCFSERTSLHPLSGTSVSVYGDQSVETIKDQTSHLQHVTLTHRTLRFSVTTTSSSKRRRGRWRGPGRGRTSVDSPLSSLTPSLRTSANISLLRST